MTNELRIINITDFLFNRHTFYHIHVPLIKYNVMPFITLVVVRYLAVNCMKRGD